MAPVAELPPTKPRPSFVKGPLETFAVHPMTRRNFIGIGAGVSALPSDTNTVLNAFFLTIEPQFDFINERFNWRLGFAAPLQFQLADTRALLENCVAQARDTRAAGGDQNAVALTTGTCVQSQQARLTENFGKLRRADWDEASDFAKLLRYFIVGGPEQPFYLNVGRLTSQSLGHGTVLRNYNPNIDYNTARVGASFDFNRAAVGLQGTANDLIRPDVLGVMLFARPFRPFSEDVFLRSLSFGISLVHGVNQPHALLYEPGLFTPSFDQPIPRVDSTLHQMGAGYTTLNTIGGDVEMKLLRTQDSDLKLYLDYQKAMSFGSGITLGGLYRFSTGAPATRALRARAELQTFDADYLPSFYDAWHDIFLNQYLPIGYTASNGLRYHPTKLGYLTAAKGGKRRIGGSFDVTHAFLDYLSAGVTLRAFTLVGSPVDSNWKSLAFPDYGPGCTDRGGGDLNCGTRVINVEDRGFTSLRLHLELPFRRFLQAFASYEVFSTNSESGLGLFRFNGDNELMFAGARLMLLPILFVQAETRRYFFIQRVRNVDFDALTLEQDQNYHASWTFALSVYVGYEFD